MVQIRVNKSFSIEHLPMQSAKQYLNSLTILYQFAATLLPLHTMQSCKYASCYGVDILSQNNTWKHGGNCTLSTV